MAVIAGLKASVLKDAVVESTTAGWSIRDLGESARCPGSNTQGGDNSTAGNADWMGRYRNYGYTPLIFPGDTFTFSGSIDQANGVSGAAIAERITLHIPGEEGGNVQYQVELASNGTLSYGAAVAVDSSAVGAVNAAGRKAALDDGDGFDDVSETRSMRLVLGARNRRYAASGSPGVVRRTPGLVYAQFMYQCYTNDPTTIPVRGSTAILRFYVTAALFWEVKWVRVEVIDDFGAEIEGAENVGYTVAGSFVSRIASTTGYIKDPAGATRWPT